MIALSGITKRYGAVTALDDVSLSIEPGEVIALAGENGSGKSTLAKVLSGVVVPDGGRIEIDGEEVRFGEPKHALDRGIGLVAQELTVVPALSVYENVMLPVMRGHATRIVNRRELIARTRALLERLGLSRIDPRRRVEQLGPVEQTFVEIAKALVTEPRVLILDEATSRLSAEEVVSVLAMVRELRDQGLSTIMITHRIAEMTTTADRAVVLRDGRYAGELASSELDEERLVRLMVGRDLKAKERGSRTDADDQGSPVLVADRVRVEKEGPEASLAVHAGEIVGLAGLVGAGRTELLECLYGLRPRHGGRLEIGGAPVAPSNVRGAIDAGLSLVPEERRGQGLIVGDTIENNYHLGSPPWYRLVRRRRMRRETREAIARFGVKARDVLAGVSTLSGGNQQKVVIARSLSSSPRVLLLDEPTRGVDVGAREEIYDIVREQARSGMGVLLASSDMTEILGVADRVLVMHEHAIVGELRGDEITEDNIGLLSAGGRKEAS
ncbi:MAG: sugar ABC transporter ATP-binding protein [Candidatus Leucobacter sulfamidivorax]|nr:sugar ABC transporter ATP-binding protein [Candidatus Leucobacter sulfamidivorax]